MDDLKRINIIGDECEIVSCENCMYTDSVRVDAINKEDKDKDVHVHKNKTLKMSKKMQMMLNYVLKAI